MPSRHECKHSADDDENRDDVDRERDVAGGRQYQALHVNRLRDG